VAYLGVLMRYKIGFRFPFFDQKHLQHAHSHFAFSGWITHTLFVLILCCSPFINDLKQTRKYHFLLWLNLIAAYGMLISFAVQGYDTISIIFSTISVLVCILFCFFYFTDSSRQQHLYKAVIWFKAALGFSVFSALGTFALAYMMAAKNFSLNWYLGSVYFYLHFQYNGWFFFSCFGLLFHQLQRYFPSLTVSRNLFRLFFISCIPAFLLSVLWARLPVWLYSLAIAGAVIQFAGWVFFIRFIRSKIPEIKTRLPGFVQLIFLIVFLALTVKLLLQLGSTVPVISKLAFGFRPVVIAYLHLVLLVIISLFLIGFLVSTGHINHSGLTRKALFLFAGGILVNECLLALQGILSFGYVLVPCINEMLFGAAIIIFTGTALLVISSYRNSQAIL
jgi:hypothetical protein